MYKIGEFSKITNLTIKALHYYDEIGILKPHTILENGYRIYNDDDFKKAMQIQLLKNLDFSINEIKDVLTNISNENDLQDYLLEKKLMIEKKIKKEKLVRYVGFSFHDTFDVFKEIVDDYDWDFAQIQHNYIDEDYQAGNEGLLYARNKGLGIIIMEPLRGGSLVNNLSPEIKAIIRDSKIEKTAPMWAFKFLYNKDEIDVVLSGMSTIEQVIDNLKIADNEGIPNSMTSEEEETLNKLKVEFKSKIKVNCTGCKYCIPCPVGVDIPKCFELLNNSSMFNDIETPKSKYNAFVVSENAQASNCVKCGACEKKCPQHIRIREKLEEVVNTLEK